MSEDVAFTFLNVSLCIKIKIDKKCYEMSTAIHLLSCLQVYF